MKYPIEAGHLPLSYRGILPQPPTAGVYLERTADSVSKASEISCTEYNRLESGFAFEGLSDTSKPFTHFYTGYVHIEASGLYAFYVRANFSAEVTAYDGERGTSVSVSGGAQAERSETGEISFDGEGYFRIDVKYCSPGEASPVLELYFGKKPRDAATREELPLLRELYVLESPYASFAGNGRVIRPGVAFGLELENNNSYMTIYGGTVTVQMNGGTVSYPFTGKNALIPSTPIDNGTTIPPEGCPATVTVHASRNICTGGITYRTYIFDAKLLTEFFRENGGTQQVCACSNPTETADECISFRQNIGRTPWVTGAPVGQLFIEEDRPRSAMLSPEILKYRHVMRRSLHGFANVSSSARLEVWDGCGEIINYDLTTGRATGLSVTEDSMLMSSGSEWVEQFADRSQVVYDSAGQMVRYVTNGGIVLGTSDFGIDIVESNNRIKQIYSIADGLMNVTSATSAGTSGSFRIDWYSPNAVLSSGTTGYVTSAGANPVKSFLFSGTYQPALNGRDLRFHLTESRYGGTQTYYTGWEYSEDYDSYCSAMNYQGWAMYKGSAPNAIQQTELRMITSGEYSSRNFHVSNVIVSGACSLADYVSSGGVALYERNAEVNCGGLGNSREDERIGSDSERTESSARISSGYGVGKASSTEDRYGSSAYYEYDSLSRLKKTESPDGYDWLYTSYSYPQTPANGFPDYRPAAIVSSYDYIDPDDPDPSRYFKQTTYSYQDNAAVGRSETVVQSANGSALTTERVWYPVAGAVVSGGTRTTALNFSEGRLKTVRNEDGTMTSYSYGAVAVSGMPSSGTIFTESATEGYCSNGSFATLPGKSVRRVNSYNVCGDLVGQERFVCLSNGAFVSIGSDSFQYNLTHQRTSAVFANGQTSSASWNCTGPTSEISVDGVTTTYQYDGLKRCIGKVTSSPNGTITESYTLDHAGNIVQTTVTGGGLSLSSSAIYDQEGRVVSSTDPAGQTTSWEYSYDRRTTWETHADGGEIETNITREGMPYSISGTAATRKHAWYYTSDYTMQVREEYEGTGDHWQCTCTDGHGHVVLTEAPSFDYDTVVSASQFYDTLGRHISTFVSGQPGLSKTYDAMGNPLAEILSGGTSIRTTLTNTNFVSSAGAVYQVAVTSTFASNTASGTSTTPLVTSKITRLYPLSNALRAQETTVDVRGNSATTSESYNPTSHTHTIVRSYPGISNLESAVQRDGLLLSSVSILGGTTSYAYDGLHRQVAQTDPRGNVTSQIYNSYGQVASVIEPTGAVTTYGYDNMGRMTRVVNALGGTVSYTYNPRGQKLSESGNATYPVEYEYDDDTGLLSAHCLHRNSNTDDRTYYYYDSCTLLLKEKCDANGSSVRYEYDSNGLLSKRTWARTTSNGADLITSYTYNVFGELTSVSYNDTTPNVSFTRDALGREVGRSDGAGSHTTVYNAYGEVTSEQHSIPNATVSYSYDSLGRQAEITASSGGSTFYQTSQSYNPATGQVISATFASSATFTFGYVPGTDLESSIVTSAFTKTVTYEANRDLPSEIKYLNSGTSLFSPKFNYTYDLLGRVTTRVRDYETNTFAYNPRSEVTSAYVSNTLRTYQYDDAGNRTLADGIFQHETNALNQYTSVGSNYSPTYDADGNQTSYWPAVVSNTDYAPRSIEYDAENRAVLFRDSNNSPLISCQYDAYGRRFRKNTYSGNTIVKQTCFLYAGTNLIAEFDQTDPCFPNFVLNNIFFWDPTQPIATRTLATIIYYHEEDSFSQSLYYYTHDLTKNVWNITNADGYSGDSFHYDAFGTLLQDHGADRLHFLFSNEYYDTETGLYYYLFRYYNPFDGRWLSKDPIGEEGGWNLYVFCENNAVNTWDVNGEFEWGEMWDDFTYKVGHAVEAFDDAIGGHFEDISNFAAGASDSLTFGVTQLSRMILGTDETVSSQSKSYIAGEITEMTVELLVLGSSKALIKMKDKTIEKKALKYLTDGKSATMSDALKKAKTDIVGDLRKKARKKFKEALKNIPVKEQKNWPVHHVHTLLGHQSLKNSYFPTIGVPRLANSRMNLKLIPKDIHSKYHKIAERAEIIVYENARSVWNRMVLFFTRELAKMAKENTCNVIDSE